MRVWWSASVVLLSAMFSMCASAIDLRLTGFGTIGAARSTERDHAYLRYIDKGGSAKADSIFGAQVEASFDARWGAVIQAVAAAPRDRDDGFDARIRWAFASFRPGNDWLIRAGRIRPPFFFHTQNSEVGVTYDQARLPPEVYAIGPIYDFDGGSIIRYWSAGATEVTVEAFWGKSNATLRGTARDIDLTIFERSRVRARGLIFSVAQGELSLRAGVHEAVGTFPDSSPVVASVGATDPFAPAPPPLGGLLYAPTDLRQSAKLSYVTLGVDWQIGDTRITAELANRDANVDTSIEALGSYVTLAHRFGRWTPNLTLARILSSRRTREIYQTVSDTPVPLLAQGPPFALPPSYHRLLMDSSILAYDQRSVALGASYAFSPTSKLKLEWMHSRIGFHSSFFDGDLSNKSVNVMTAVYTVAF